MGGRRGTGVPLVFQPCSRQHSPCLLGAGVSTKRTVLRESDDQKEPVGAARVAATQ